MIENLSRLRREIGEQTRNKIIQAAKQLFAKNGFSGTSISQIAKTAKINHSLIFHHFINKAELWEAVKYSFYQTSYQDQFSDHNDLKDFIQHFVTQRFKYFEKYPEAARMLAWQSLDPDSANLMGCGRNILERWSKKINDFQQQGQITRDLDPELIYIFITTTTSAMAVNQYAALKNTKKKELYLNMIINGLTKALSL